MNASLEERDRAVRYAAQLLADMVAADKQSGFHRLHCIPLSLASELTGLERRTVKDKLPIVELTANKHAVRMCDIHDYLDAKTTQPKRK